MYYVLRITYYDDIKCHRYVVWGFSYYHVMIIISAHDDHLIIKCRQMAACSGHNCSTKHPKSKKNCFSVSMIFWKKCLNLNNKLLRQKYHGSFRVLSLSFCGRVWSTAFWMYATQINCLYFIPESTSSKHVMAVLDLEPNDKIMSGL